MSLDAFERATIDILNGGLIGMQSPVENVLGFYVDKHHNNMGMMQGLYVYEEEDVLVSDVAGSSLCMAPDRTLVRSYTPTRSRSLFYLGSGGGSANDIGLSVLYNGKVLVVTELTVHGPKAKGTVDYAKLVLKLHHFVSGTRMGLYEHRKESIDFISKIALTEYVPVTCSYPDLLSKVIRAVNQKTQVTVTPKHDGTSCWVYVSRTTPPSLVLHTKHRRSFSYRYVGRIECLKGLASQRPYAILVEMVPGAREKRLIAIDAFSDEPSGAYRERHESMKLMLQGFCNKKARGAYLSTYVMELSQGSLLQAPEGQAPGVLLPSPGGQRVDASGSKGQGSIAPESRGQSTSPRDQGASGAVPQKQEGLSLCDIMGARRKHTDGYILYIGSERPCKIKLSSMCTLDIEYMYDVSGLNVTHSWNIGSRERELMGPLEDPLRLHPYLEPRRLYVLEVKVSDGKTVRVRVDRSRGNSKQVVDSVLRTYSKDSKYSLESVWSGEDVRFVILANRVFKHYAYATYIPKDSRIVDMGSGNGGDSQLWEEMGYRVLAVEADVSRSKVLKAKVSSNPNVLVRTGDMAQVAHMLHSATLRYTHATFMRSIGHLSPDAIISLLSMLRRYRMQRIVVVTMLRELTRECSLSDRAGNTFAIELGDQGATRVRYQLASKGARYDDRCYDLQAWGFMAKQSGYLMSVEYQWDVMVRAYGLKRSELLYPCSTDAIIVLDNSEHL